MASAIYMMLIPRPNADLMVADFVLGFFAALGGASLVAFIANALPDALQKLNPVVRALWQQGLRLYDRSAAAIRRPSMSIETGVAARLEELTRRTRVMR